TTPAILSALRGFGGDLISYKDTNLSQKLVNRDWREFGPRLGFAYRALPRCYLRYFATPESRDTENPLVWVFSKDASEPILTSVRQIGAQCFLYSPKDPSGNRRLEMEAKL